MRGFIIVGTAVAVSLVALIYVIGTDMAKTDRDAICRNEQILLAVSKSQGTIGEIRQERNDLVVTTEWRRWIGLNRQRKIDIGMAAWCVVAHEGKGGKVLIKSGDTEVGRVVAGKRSSKFGE